MSRVSTTPAVEILTEESCTMKTHGFTKVLNVSRSLTGPVVLYKKMFEWSEISMGRVKETCHASSRPHPSWRILVVKGKN